MMMMMMMMRRRRMMMMRRRRMAKSRKICTPSMPLIASCMLPTSVPAINTMHSRLLGSGRIALTNQWIRPRTGAKQMSKVAQKSTKRSWREGMIKTVRFFGPPRENKNLPRSSKSSHNNLLRLPPTECSKSKIGMLSMGIRKQQKESDLF